MKILFPGQGSQNINMLLNPQVQEFLCCNGLQKQLDEVLQDNQKLFDTEFAQPLIVGSQLYEAERLEKTISNRNELEYMGLSLGEITALIASKAINIKDGLRFTSKRGTISKFFSDNELQQDLKSGDKKRSFGVIRLPLTDELIKNISDWNQNHCSALEQISITNFIPSKNNPEKEDVTITADEVILRENIIKLGGIENQKMFPMQCPFHSIALEKLSIQQKQLFMETIASIDNSKLSNVFSTRMASYYNNGTSIKNISDSLAQYLLEPMQTTKMLKHLKESNDLLIVTTSKKFSDNLKKQYSVLGGSDEQIIYINDYLIDKEPQSIVPEK